MPPTREHLEILAILGIPAGVIAITKCDLVDADWLALVEDDIRRLVADTFLASAPIVPTSITTGEGIEALKRALQALCDQAPAREDSGLFRLAIDRSFTVAGHGTVVTGTVSSGIVAVGDELELWPKGQRVRVRGLHRHGQPVDSAARGARAALNLAGIHHAEVERGHVLASPGYLAPAQRLTIELRASTDAPRPLRHRQRYKLHLGTAEVSARLSLLSCLEARPGETALAQLLLEEPTVAVSGQPFVLRDESPPTTLGGGTVLQPLATRIHRRDEPATRRVLSLRAANAPERLAAAFCSIGLHSPTPTALSRESGLSLAQVESALPVLQNQGRLLQLPIAPRRTVPIPAELVADLEQRLLRSLARMHNARPRQSSLRKAEVLAAMPGIGSETLVQALLERLRAAGAVVVDDRTLALKSHVPRLSQAEQRLKDELARAIREGGLSPPDRKELETLAGSRASALSDLLALLREEGHLVEITPEFWLDADVEAALRKSVVNRLTAPDCQGLTVAQLRDLLGTTRKYAVPIAEHLDRAGVTRREGDMRYLASTNCGSTT
jgi:selenocysteine-specific elongation factor